MTKIPLPGVTLTRGPQDWQILQRDGQSFGAFELIGTVHCPAAEFRPQVRIVRESDGAPVNPSFDWREVSPSGTDGWTLLIERLPSGGLYRVETRVWVKGDRPLRGDCIHHLGVGDLWVIAGQSNASGTGLGVVDDPPVFGVHQLGNDERWKVASHPLEDATHTLHPMTVHGIFHGHSAWLSFGKYLQRYLGYPIGLVPTALAGSPISLWQPGAVLFSNLLEMVRIAGGRIRGIAWYQGESDALEQTTVDTYELNFRAFANGVRAALFVPGLPIITAQLSRYMVPPAGSPLHANWTRLREIQRTLAKEFLGTVLVPTIDLPLGDEIHLTALAEMELGRRFAAAALEGITDVPVEAPGMALLDASWGDTERRRIRLRFEVNQSGWVLVGECRDFTVEDSKGPIGVQHVRLDDPGLVELTLARPAQSPAHVSAHAGCVPAVALRDRDQRPIVAFTCALN